MEHPDDGLVVALQQRILEETERGLREQEEHAALLGAGIHVRPLPPPALTLSRNGCDASRRSQLLWAVSGPPHGPWPQTRGMGQWQRWRR